MGEIQRAQELRVDEVSVQKLRENHETIQRLTSQLQRMQELMNSMNDSGDSQDVESNVCGRLCHVSSQPVMIPHPKRRESDDKNALAIVKSVSQLSCVPQDSDALVSLKVESLGETRCRKSWNQFKEYDSQSLRFVKRASGKREDHRWEK